MNSVIKHLETKRKQLQRDIAADEASIKELQETIDIKVLRIEDNTRIINDIDEALIKLNPEGQNK